MKVSEPRFDGDGSPYCDDCPFNENDDLCVDKPCPTAETYAEACALAEAAEKEGR